MLENTRDASEVGFETMYIYTSVHTYICVQRSSASQFVVHDNHSRFGQSVTLSSVASDIVPDSFSKSDMTMLTRIDVVGPSSTDVHLRLFGFHRFALTW
jgi:hypothetical protein